MKSNGNCASVDAPLSITKLSATHKVAHTVRFHELEAFPPDRRNSLPEIEEQYANFK